MLGEQKYTAEDTRTTPAVCRFLAGLLERKIEHVKSLYRWIRSTSYLFFALSQLHKERFIKENLSLKFPTQQHTNATTATNRYSKDSS